MEGFTALGFRARTAAKFAAMRAISSIALEIEKGRMMPPGAAVIRKADPSWLG
jgi:hypothetical protein